MGRGIKTLKPIKKKELVMSWPIEVHMLRENPLSSLLNLGVVDLRFSQSKSRRLPRSVDTDEHL